MLAHRSAHRKKKHPQTRKLHPLRPQPHQHQHQHQRLSPHRNQQRSLRLNRLKKHRSITSGLRSCNDQLRPRGREGLHPCAHGNRTSVRLCHKMGFLLSWLGHRKMGAHYCACRLNCTRPHPSALLERDRGGHDRTLCSFDLQAPQESSKSAAARIVTRKGTE